MQSDRMRSVVSIFRVGGVKGTIKIKASFASDVGW